MIKENFDNVASRTSEISEKDIAYTDEAKSFINEHPGFILAAKKGIDAAVLDYENNKIYENELVVVEFLDEGSPLSETFRFKVTEKKSGEAFFVKTKLNIGMHELGAEELRIMAKVKKALAGFEDKKIEVVDYFLGYKDSHRCYYVARFDQRLRETVADSTVPINADVQRRIIALQNFLRMHPYASYGDLGKHNISYDKNTDVLIIFDIRE